MTHVPSTGTSHRVYGLQVEIGLASVGEDLSVVKLDQQALFEPKNGSVVVVVVPVAVVTVVVVPVMLVDDTVVVDRVTVVEVPVELVVMAAGQPSSLLWQQLI